MMMFGGIGVVSLFAGMVSSGAVAQVSTGEIRWNGTVVLRLLAGGRLAAEALDGHVVRALDAAARPVFRAARREMREVGGFIEAELRAESALSWGVVARVVLTLELAGADRVKVEALRGDGRDAGGRDVGTEEPEPASRAIVSALHRHRGIKWSSYPTIWLTRRGISVYTHPSGRVAHCLAATGREWVAALAAIREVFANERNLAVMAEDAISFRDMLRVRARARALGFLQATFRPGLFR
jgi:hypothetical protein